MISPELDLDVVLRDNYLSNGDDDDDDNDGSDHGDNDDPNDSDYSESSNDDSSDDYDDVNYSRKQRSKTGKRASSSKGITTVGEYIGGGSFGKFFLDIMIIKL